MEALCSSSLGTPGHVTAILKAKNRQKVDKLNWYILVRTDYDEAILWFFILAHHQPSFF